MLASFLLIPRALCPRALVSSLVLYVPLVVLVAAGCGDDLGGSGGLSAGESATEATATTEVSGATAASGATAGEPTATGAETSGDPSDASASASDPTTGDPTTGETTSSGDTSGETTSSGETTGESEATGVDSDSEGDSEGDSESDSDSDSEGTTTDGGCLEGTEGCPCAGGQCDGDLVCDGGICVIVEPPAICGNGIVEDGEECDDGNQQNFDDCDNTCKLTNFGSDACGFLEDGVWLEISYANAGSCYSPSWKFSNTPGFGQAQWAPTNESWPIIHAAGGPVITNDPYGKVCDIGSGNKWIRIMHGLATLQSYESATVCLEGRSISVSSPVTVDLVNPAQGYCGSQVVLSQSWWADPAGAELPPGCLAPGNPFQALQIDPVGGSNRLGLQKARITLHKPVF